MSRVHIKLLSGDLLSLEVDAQITISGFYRAVFDEMPDVREMWQLMLMRMVEGEFKELEVSDEILQPEEDEVFSAFVESVTYTVDINLASTEVFDSLHDGERYELYDIKVTRYMESTMTTTLQGIYVRPMYGPEENIHYYLEGDRHIPAECMGRFGDEWDIKVHEDATMYHSVGDVVNHMKFGEELSDRGKGRVREMIQEKWMELVHAMFSEWQNGEEDDGQYEEYPEESVDSWS
jgi:hypothetical protein